MARRCARAFAELLHTDLLLPFALQIKGKAMQDFKIDLKGPPAEWPLTKDWREKRKDMMVIFVMDRTYPDVLQAAVDAALSIYYLRTQSNKRSRA